MKVKIALSSALFALFYIAGCGTQCGDDVCFGEIVEQINDPFAVSYIVHYNISFDPKHVQRSATADSDGCFAPDGIRDSKGNLVCPSKSQINTKASDWVVIEEEDAWYGNDGNMMHDTGEPDSQGDGGWSAIAGYDGYGLLMYGPPYAYYPNGNYTAGWKLMLNSVPVDQTLQLVELDVIDVITSQELGYTIITGDQFKNMYDYEPFGVSFTVTNSTHPIQLRCIWMGQASITTLGCGLGVNKQ